MTVQRFTAGAAEVDITPLHSLPMDGYMARDGSSQGTHDPLMAQILILSDGINRAVIIALDVLVVSADFALPIRQAVARLVGASVDAVLVCPSHTHCGPVGLQNWFPPGDAPELDSELTAFIQERILNAATQALSSIEPVRLVDNTGTVKGIGGNRNDPALPVDSRVTVLCFQRMNGETLCILFHYACHPTVLGAATQEYSADFPGAARRQLRSAFPHTISMFLNGALGDVSTRYQRCDQSFDEVNRMGKLLAETVIALLEQPHPVELAIAWTKIQVELPFRTIPDAPAPLQSIAAGLSRAEQTQAEGAAIQAKISQAIGSRTTQPATVSLLKIGRWTLCGIPGEPYNALATNIWQTDLFALILGVTNDYVGYLPTQTAIDAQTYEALSSPYDARALNIIEATLIDHLKH